MYFPGKILLACIISLLMALKVHAGFWVIFDQLPATVADRDFIFLASNANSWNPADSAARLPIKQGVRCFVDLNLQDGANMEFKFTLGSWDQVECDSYGADVSNRQWTYRENGEYHATIVAFKSGLKTSTGQPNVTCLSDSFMMKSLQRSRRIWVMIPKDYEHNSRHYPVCYMLDGQNLFDASTAFAGEWGVDEWFNDPANKLEAIVVAIESDGQSRMNELMPWYNSSLQAGGEGNAFVQFISEELKPYIDSTYRTFVDPVHTTIAGSSLGGLIAWYALAAYPHIFGNAAVFSPALWVNPEFQSFLKENIPSPSSKLWVGCGDAESETMVPLMKSAAHVWIDAGIATQDLKEVVIPGGGHNEKFWNSQLTDAFHWTICNENIVVGTNEDFRLTTDDQFRSLVLESVLDASFQIVCMQNDLILFEKKNLNRTDAIDIRDLKTGDYTIHISASTAGETLLKPYIFTLHINRP